MQSYNIFRHEQPPFHAYLDGPLTLVPPGPAGLPIDLADVRAQCLIDDDIDSVNIWLRSKIAEVTDSFEKEAGGRQLVAATWRMPVRAWWGSFGGGPGIYGLGYGLSYGLNCGNGTIQLPRPPLLSPNVIVTYFDANDSVQTLDDSLLVVSQPQRQPAEIQLAPYQVWPSLSPLRRYPITIQFTAGYVVPVMAVSTGGSTLTVAGLAYAADQVIVLSNSGGLLPAPLQARTTYYVVNPTNGGLTFQVSLTLGGSAIPLTSLGSGSNYIGQLPGAVKNALLLQVAYAFRNREPGAEDQYLYAALERMAGQEWSGGYG